MRTPTREEQRRIARLWRETGPLLDALRDEEICRADAAESLRAFATAFRIALRDLPPRESSGLVEWQRHREIWRRRG